MSALRQDTVYFSSSRDIGSNFFIAPIVIYCPVRQREREFKCNECFFQLAKLVVAGYPDVMYGGLVYGPYEFADHIVDAEPGEAKHMGRAIPMDQEAVEAWDHGEALKVMLECNLAKYQQHYECWLWLHETKGKRLVERRRDPIWGDNMDGTGKNLLGHVLELVRALVC